MRLMKCKNGHVYDADKLKNCPHCQGAVKIIESDADTYGKGQSDVLTELSDDMGNNNTSSIGTRKQVGLLVETKGNTPGSTFIIYDGNNRIGRAGNYEIALVNEDTVSKSGHADILYENGSFDIKPLKDDREVIVNGQRISECKRLEDRDIIEIGECILTFVRFDDVY